MPQQQTSENLPGGSQANGADDTTGLDMSAEARARRFGWHPKGEYHGNLADWVDADEFVRRSEEQLPVLRSTLRRSEVRAARMERDLSATSSRIASLETQLGEARDAVVSMRNMLSRAEKNSYDRAIRDIETRMDVAIADGDAAGAKKARDDLKTVTDEMATRVAEKKAEPKKDATQQQQAQVDPVAAAWVNSPDRAWYRTNPRMKGYADGVFDELRRLNPVATLQDVLDQVDDEVREQFPKHFERSRDRDDDDPPRRQERQTRRRDDDDDEAEPPRRRRAEVQEPRPVRRDRGGNGQSFDDIPRTDQDEFFKTNRALKNSGAKEITKEAWAKEYFTPFQGNTARS